MHYMHYCFTQATVSFGEFHFKDSPEPVRNVVSVPNAAFDEVTDPTRSAI